MGRVALLRLTKNRTKAHASKCTLTLVREARGAVSFDLRRFAFLPCRRARGFPTSPAITRITKEPSMAKFPGWTLSAQTRAKFNALLDEASKLGLDPDAVQARV